MHLFIGIFSAVLILGTQGTEHSINLGKQTGFFQGDIVLKQSNTRNGILKAFRWPNGIIPYVYGYQWQQENIDMIQEAMRAIERSTCIRFVPRTTEKDYIKIINTFKGCYTTVGKAGGPQVLSLMHSSGPSCFVHRTIVHELLHVVGLWHEQSRYDRDEYLTIHWDNMDQSAHTQYQYKKVLESNSSSYGIPYNYLSVMHYTADSGSINGKIVMEPKDPKYTSIIGTVDYAHEMDFEKVRRIYECKGAYTPAVTTTAPCEDTYGSCWDYTDECQKTDWVKTSCRKTCGICGGPTKPTTPPPCVDMYPDCNDFVKECRTEHWMKDSCRKTCRFCTPSNSVTVAPPKPINPVKPGGLCQDTLTYCDEYINDCRRESWMKRDCARTCGFC